MRFILKGISYILHPLFMPLLGGLLYFFLSPRFIPLPLLGAKLFAITIMTIVVPALFYLLFKNLKLVSSIFLEEVSERRIPLLCQIALVLFVLKTVLEGYEFPELHFFFVGILFSTILALILVFFKVRASLHMTGIAGVLTFIIGLSIHFNNNIIPLIAILVIATGAVATSRLYFKAHTYLELLLGVAIGAIPQVVTYSAWL